VSKKQRVRVRSESIVASRLGISTDAIGTVTCRYRIMREGEAGRDRLDVRFGANQVVWGVPEKEFEIIP
jgi:hypothetical protein